MSFVLPENEYYEAPARQQTQEIQHVSPIQLQQQPAQFAQPFQQPMNQIPQVFNPMLPTGYYYYNAGGMGLNIMNPDLIQYNPTTGIVQAPTGYTAKFDNNNIINGNAPYIQTDDPNAQAYGQPTMMQQQQQQHMMQPQQQVMMQPQQQVMMPSQFPSPRDVNEYNTFTMQRDQQLHILQQ
jgi:hypothetical protein